MSSTYVPAMPSVLKRASNEAPRRVLPKVVPARNFQVLQSRGAPAQLSLFQRSGAIDVK